MFHPLNMTQHQVSFTICLERSFTKPCFHPLPVPLQVLDCKGFTPLHMTQQAFFQHYMHGTEIDAGKPRMLKVKDWPPDEHFSVRLVRHHQVSHGWGDVAGVGAKRRVECSARKGRGRKGERKGGISPGCSKSRTGHPMNTSEHVWCGTTRSATCRRKG